MIFGDTAVYKATVSTGGPASPGYPGIPCDELVVALRRYSAPRQTAYAMEELEHPGTGTYERQQESWGFHSHGSPIARC